MTGAPNLSNCCFGGLVAGAGDKGSFIDAGDVTISTSDNVFLGGGLVGELKSGVLRLSGKTDLTDAPANSENYNKAETMDKRGQLVGIRGSALVYAIGTGNDNNASFDSGWKYTRSTTDARADDIGTWGEVVRPNGTTITAAKTETKSSTGSALFYYNTSNHTVTVAAAETDIDSVEDFVKTALNIQLNTGSLNAALSFAGTSTSKSSALLSTNMTISGEIDLSGTGITGFMRDDYVDSINEIGSFTGSLTGSNSASVKLAVGERYGLNSTGKEGAGAIYAHRYNGLFARTDNGVIIDSVAITGTVNVNAMRTTYVGGMVATANGGITLKSTDALETINFKRISEDANAVGGLIGQVGENCASNVVIQKASGAENKVTISPQIIITGSINGNELYFNKLKDIVGECRKNEDDKFYTWLKGKVDDISKQKN